MTAELMQQLLTSPALGNSCPVPFDGGLLWKGDNSE